MAKIESRSFWSCRNLSGICMLAIILIYFGRIGDCAASQNRKLSHFIEEEFSSGSKEVVKVKFLTKLRHKREIRGKDFHILEIQRPTSNSTFQIHLIKNEELLSPNFTFTVMDGDKKVEESSSPGEEEGETCFFVGHLSGPQPEGSPDFLGQAAFSACGDQPGFSGLILSHEGHFILEPHPQIELVQQNSEILHVLTPVTPGDGIHKCTGPIVAPRDSVNGGIDPPKTLSASSSKFKMSKKSKTKKVHDIKSAGEPVIDLAVVSDSSFLKNMQKKLKTKSTQTIKNFIISLVQQIAILWQSPSLETKATIRLAEVKILTNNPSNLNEAHGLIGPFMDSVCRYCGNWNKADNWDHCMMLTGLDIHDPDSNAAAGVAYLNGMCSYELSCSILEVSSFMASFAGAHEIGHSMGMSHDGDGSNKKCDPTKSIMSPTLLPKLIDWSSCSSQNMNSFLGKRSPYRSRNSCLKNTNKKGIDYDKKLPGQVYPADAQCVIFDEKQFPLPVMDGKTMGKSDYDFCKEMYCMSDPKTSGPYGMAAFAHVPLEGTKCASGKICRRGKCVT